MVIEIGKNLSDILGAFAMVMALWILVFRK